MHILLQRTPEGLDLHEVIAALQDIEGVEDIHHVHAWNLAAGRNLLSAHIRVHSFARDGERVLHGASDILKKRFGIYFSTLQIEEECVSAEADAAAIDITKRGEQLRHAH